MKNSYLYDNVSLPVQPILALTDRDGVTQFLSPAQNEYVRRPRASIEDRYCIVVCEVSMDGDTLLIHESTSENKIGTIETRSTLISVEADGTVTRGKTFPGHRYIRDMLEI